MKGALLTETPNTQASQALNIIASNIDMAAEDEQPICQDTGSILFFVDCPVGYDQITFADAARAADDENGAGCTRNRLIHPQPVE